MYRKVEVKNKQPKWTLGMYQNCLQNWQSQPLFLCRLWATGYYKSSYITLGPQGTQLLPIVKLAFFWTMSWVKLYNMNNKPLLYNFNDSFTEAVWPYFCTGTDSEPLKNLFNNRLWKMKYLGKYSVSVFRENLANKFSLSNSGSS